MDTRARIVTGGLRAAVVLSITAAGVLVGAGPAAAGEKDGIPANGGTVEVDFGPGSAGRLAVAGFQVPGSGGSVAWTTTTLDADGTGTLTTYSGPVDVYLTDPENPRDDPPATVYEVAAYRGETVTWTIDADTYEETLVGEAPIPTAPSLEALENGGLIAVGDYDLAPAQYESGVAFDLTVSGLQFSDEAPGDLDGLAVTSYIYSEPTQVGTSVIAGGAYTQTIPAEYTDEPHTYASFDEYGRLIAAASLDGGAPGEGPAVPPTAEPTPTATPTPTGTPTAAPTPTATPVPAPASPTATPSPTVTPTAVAVAPRGTTGRGTLASTGADSSGLALGGAALLLAGAVSLVAVKRRTSRA